MLSVVHEHGINDPLAVGCGFGVVLPAGVRPHSIFQSLTRCDRRQLFSSQGCALEGSKAEWSTKSPPLAQSSHHVGSPARSTSVSQGSCVLRLLTWLQECGLWSLTIWIQTLTLLTNLDKLPNPSMPQFLQLWNETNNSTYLLRLLGGWRELICVKCLE